jgi:hypothetical protein
LGDLDADGDLDVFVGNMGADEIWSNNGDGTFSDAVRDWVIHLPVMFILLTWTTTATWMLLLAVTRRVKYGSMTGRATSKSLISGLAICGKTLLL